MLPYQLQSCLRLSPSSEVLLNQPLAGHLPPSVSSPSTPRRMNDFGAFDAYDYIQPDNEPPGDSLHNLQQSGIMYGTESLTNLQYQPGTPPEANPYWPETSFTPDVQCLPSALWQLPNHAAASSSAYTTAHYTPPATMILTGQYTAAQYSPDLRQSPSAELILSPYGSPSQVSPCPTTRSHTYGSSTSTSTVADTVSHYNNPANREQVRLFNDARQLPTHLGGTFIPQRMYLPHTTSDRRRYVEQITLQDPVYFWLTNTGMCGITLSDALHGRVSRLHNLDERLFDGLGPSISVRIEWPGYRQWSRQIPTKDFCSPPKPITKAKLVKNIAKTVQRFLVTRAGQRLEDCADPRWKIGQRWNEIKLDDLILVSIHHVSMGSWQPHLRLRHDHPSSTLPWS